MTTSTPQTSDQPAVETTRWRIDPNASRVEFRTSTFWGLMTVRGRFERYDGTLDLRTEPAIDLTIDAASLNTGNSKRDRHLRSEDFFDVENHPWVCFVSDSVRLDGERLSVTGRLHAAGTTTPLEVEARLRPIDGGLEVDAIAEVDHLELGMSRGALGMIRNPSELIVSGRLVRAAD